MLEVGEGEDEEEEEVGVIARKTRSVCCRTRLGEEDRQGTRVIGARLSKGDNSVTFGYHMHYHYMWAKAPPRPAC